MTGFIFISYCFYDRVCDNDNDDFSRPVPSYVVPSRVVLPYLAYSRRAVWSMAATPR